MRTAPLAATTLLALLAGCATRPLPPVVVAAPPQPISFLEEVKPLLDRRCTVCHSCYNAPCQLKLDSYEGAARGATRMPVYDGTRLSPAKPTRLFADAASPEAWRKKGFFPVTASRAKAGLNDSIMLQLLELKRRAPTPAGSYRSEADDLACPKDGGEVADFAAQHPEDGMPFGFPPLAPSEHALLAGWLAQGAPGPSPAEQAALEAPSPEAAAWIARFEAFLDAPDPKHAVTARYLYEHLFLAHLHFPTPAKEFYELVRSRTGPGKPIDLVATVRPYDDPGVATVHYRLRKIHSTIVQKTHMVYELDEARLRRWQALFIDAEWPEAPHLVGWDRRASANPFKAFAQLPPRSRYAFLLDDAQYVIMTFIHGPVCKGQIALNVINDHFWIMFLDPARDLAVNEPAFLPLHADELAVPSDKGSDPGLFSSLTDEHKKLAVAYYRARQETLAAVHPEGLGLDAIWKGERPTDTPFLTVYRHFDSASVHAGALGNLPKTLWVIDYPLLERIYYSLVAGFDVYGTLGHQLTTRLYMDRLRIEGESGFLDLLPPAARQPTMQAWYGDVRLDSIDYLPAPMPAAIRFETEDPKRELVERVVAERLDPAVRVAFDPINYLKAGEAYPPIPERLEAVADVMRGFRALSRPGTPFVAMLRDHDANLAYVRLRLRSGQDLVFTGVVDRWHQDIAFLLGEDRRLDPSRDALEFIPGLIGSYPNMFFDVRQDDLPDLLDLLATFDGSAAHRQRLARYAINRADARFWDTYDWFQRRFDEDEPVRGGLLDLNRYFHQAH